MQIFALSFINSSPQSIRVACAISTFIEIQFNDNNLSSQKWTVLEEKYVSPQQASRIINLFLEVIFTILSIARLGCPTPISVTDGHSSILRQALMPLSNDL